MPISTPAKSSKLPQQQLCSSPEEHKQSPSIRRTVLLEENTQKAREEFRRHAIDGLSKPLKSLSSMYFYDDYGSDLYAQITDLEEYYLTRTEREILETHAAAIVEAHFVEADKDGPINVIELGAGDGRKTKILLEALLDQGVNFEYVPIDISRQAMADLFESMGSFFNNRPLAIHGLIGDYLTSVQHVVSAYPQRRNVVLFIGSSIGNFSTVAAKRFLTQLRSHLTPQDLLLLGYDLRKEPEVMRKAYSDSGGVTRDFNLNLLTRMNRELGTNFDTSDFEHLAIYNPRIGAMESYLFAKREHRIVMKEDPNIQENEETRSGKTGHVQGSHEFLFKAFEHLHMECSSKYSVDQIHNMLQSAGFIVRADYSDKRNWFVDSMAEVSDCLEDREQLIGSLKS